MGCGSSSPTEEHSTPKTKRKSRQEFELSNIDQQPADESLQTSPLPYSTEPEVIKEAIRVPNGSSSPRKTPHTSPRQGGNQSNRSKSKYDEREEVVDSESSDKGFKKRVRQKLIEATKDGDIEELTKMIETFEKQKLEDCGDLRRAQDRLQFLKHKRDLRDSIRRRHAGVLDKTIQDAKNSKFSDRLQSQIEVAEKLRNHLQELNRYSHDICKMEQSTISELRSYQRPPSCVHDVMAATYMLLGYPEDRLGDWNEIQAHLGQLTRDKLIRQVSEFDTNNVEDDTCTRVKSILDSYSVEEVKAASYGAATFYVWANNIVDKIEKDTQREHQEQQQQQQPENEEETTQPPEKGGRSVKKKG